MKYQSLTIENFRGITKLEINDLKTINLLVGRNNCGKTSVLEAVFLLSGMSNPTLPVNIQNLRGISIIGSQEFISMFKDLNFKNRILLEGELDNKKRSLTITPLYAGESERQFNKPEELITPQYNYTPSTISEHTIEGIKLDCRNHKDELVHQGEINFKKRILDTSLSSYKEVLQCSYLNPQTIMFDMTPQLGNLIVQKKLDTIISVLREIEPKIADIRIGAKGIIYMDVGGENLLPINIMGDGIRRLLAFLANLAENKNGVLLIDEIENGFHYASIKVGWKAILAACKEYNVQLIATTHSYECIEALSDCYAEIEPDGDDIRIYRLDRDGDKHKAFSSSARVLRAGIEKDFEVR